MHLPLVAQARKLEVNPDSFLSLTSHVLASKMYLRSRYQSLQMLLYKLALPHPNWSPYVHARLLQSTVHIVNKFCVWNANQIAPAPTATLFSLKSRLIRVAYRLLHEQAPAHLHHPLPTLPGTHYSPATWDFCSSKATSSFPPQVPHMSHPPPLLSGSASLPSFS